MGRIGSGSFPQKQVPVTVMGQNLAVQPKTDDSSDNSDSDSNSEVSDLSPQVSESETNHHDDSPLKIDVVTTDARDGGGCHPEEGAVVSESDKEEVDYGSDSVEEDDDVPLAQPPAAKKRKKDIVIKAEEDVTKQRGDDERERETDKDKGREKEKEKEKDFTPKPARERKKRPRKDMEGEGKEDDDGKEKGEKWEKGSTSAISSGLSSKLLNLAMGQSKKKGKKTDKKEDKDKDEDKASNVEKKDASTVSDDLNKTESKKKKKRDHKHKQKEPMPSPEQSEDETEGELDALSSRKSRRGQQPILESTLSSSRASTPKEDDHGKKEKKSKKHDKKEKERKKKDDKKEKEEREKKEQKQKSKEQRELKKEKERLKKEAKLHAASERKEKEKEKKEEQEKEKEKRAHKQNADTSGGGNRDPSREDMRAHSEGEEAAASTPEGESGADVKKDKEEATVKEAMSEREDGDVSEDEMPPQSQPSLLADSDDERERGGGKEREKGKSEKDKDNDREKETALRIKKEKDKDKDKGKGKKKDKTLVEVEVVTKDKDAAAPSSQGGGGARGSLSIDTAANHHKEKDRDRPSPEETFSRTRIEKLKHYQMIEEKDAQKLHKRAKKIKDEGDVLGGAKGHDQYIVGEKFIHAGLGFMEAAIAMMQTLKEKEDANNDTRKTERKQIKNILKETGVFFEHHATKLEKKGKEASGHRSLGLRALASINYKCMAICHLQLHHLLKERIVKNHQKLSKVNIAALEPGDGEGHGDKEVVTSGDFQSRFDTFMKDVDEMLKGMLAWQKGEGLVTAEECAKARQLLPTHYSSLELQGWVAAVYTALSILREKDKKHPPRNKKH